MKMPKRDWQTIVAILAFLGLIISVIFTFLHKAQPTTPEMTQREIPLVGSDNSAIIIPLSTMNSDGTISAGNQRISPEERSLANQSGHIDNGIQQLDYETRQKLQTQIISRLREQIRQHGPGPDGVTEEDLDRMLKNGQLPQ